MSFYGDIEKEMHDEHDVKVLRAENEKLRAELLSQQKELEALKPKPVVEVRYMSINTKHTEFYEATDRKEEGDNLKLTFHDGVLTKAEVIG